MIFLSASVPVPGKQDYYETADALAIQAAVRAAVLVVLPKSALVWGGHPAITTIIHHTVGRMPAEVRDRLTMYQSEYFKTVYPKEHFFFNQITTVPETTDKKISITNMRRRMLEDHPFKAGIFIGGMHGVEKEYEMFRTIHPNAAIFPIASTGAAARAIYDRMDTPPDPRLSDDYEYISLLQTLLQDYL